MVEIVSTGNSTHIHIVLVKANKDIQIKRVPTKENRAMIGPIGRRKKVEVEFSGQDIGRVWVRRPPTFRHKYEPAILVREGASRACPLHKKGDFISPLTQEENANMIKRKIGQAIAEGKIFTNIQFLVIVGLLALICILAVLNLANFNLVQNTPVQNVTGGIPTQTPFNPPITPPIN